MKRTGAGTLRTDDVGRRVRLAAWVKRRRDLGGLVFLDLRDRSGVAQVVVHPESNPEVVEALDPVRQEWVVEVVGEVRPREPEAVNPDMETGQVEVVAREAKVLSRSEPVVFSIDGKGTTGEATEETRLTHRYLDLRRAELTRNLVLRDEVTLAVRNHLHGEGFVDVETPILTRSTPEGARDYLVPSRVHPGSFYALPQSPQIFKQILMVAGLERYVQIARCFRDEDLRADRQPEFTQVDLEMSFVEEADVMEVTEGLLRHVFPLAGIEPPDPLPRLGWDEAMARYGSDRPDLRFGLEIADLSDVLGESGFNAFRKTVEKGGVVRGLALPGSTGAAGASRKTVDAWVEIARRHGAAGVLTLKSKDGELIFQVKGTLTEGELAAAAGRLGLEEGGIALLVAAEEPVAAAALGALRTALAREYDLVPEGEHAFCWVTDFPLFEWDEEAGRWFSSHHPFTSPAPEDLDLLEEDPGKVRSRAYDVVMDGVELGGGSIRIHDREVQTRVFRALGIGPEEARSRFGFLLDALAYGAPPHGGIALGLDRIVMLMAGASSIREVIAFPKTTAAADLMTGAPSGVGAAQLAELGIALTAEAGEGAGGDGGDDGGGSG